MNSELALLIERSAELKGDLVRFGHGPRFERALDDVLLEAAGPDDELDQHVAISVTDHFLLQRRLPNGKTVLELFVASRPDLSATDREMLLGWRDPVEGLFEFRRRDGDGIILLNLLDDLEYRTYSNVGRGAFRSLPKGGFLLARLVPLGPDSGAWLISGSMSAYRKSEAAMVARTALELATTDPELVFRNPEKVKQGWEQMRENRAAFVDFFGSDELVLPVAEAEEQVNAFYRKQQEAALARNARRVPGRDVPGVDSPLLQLPQELAEGGPIGVIFDEVDGLSFCPGYGLLRDLFGDPALAADKRYADMLRHYLRDDTITPSPLLRLAAAFPDTVDTVFGRVLRRRHFTWSEHGETLLRQRKPWYYERERRPGVTVIGERLTELASRR